MTAGEKAWRPEPDASGVRVRVKVTPKSSNELIEGIETTTAGPALRARVRAAPEDGKANAAVEALIASWLEIPKRSVNVAAGHKSRMKSIAIAGDPATISKHLDLKLRSLTNAAQES